MLVMQEHRKLFVAGATGAVGRTVMRIAETRGVDVVPHVRPKTAAQGRSLHSRAAVLELSQTDELANVLKDRTTVLQLIGTMRKRFATGDTYESSDIGTTQHLVAAARRAGTIDHFILLSSVGAGRPMGAYLQAKARAEAIVRDSGIPFTIFRPSAFVGEGHRLPPGAEGLMKLIGTKKYRPIPVETLAKTLLYVVRTRAPLGQVLEGEELWRIVGLEDEVG